MSEKIMIAIDGGEAILLAKALNVYASTFESNPNREAEALVVIGFIKRILPLVSQQARKEEAQARDLLN